MVRPTKNEAKGTLDTRMETRMVKAVQEILRKDELNAKLPAGKKSYLSKY